MPLAKPFSDSVLHFERPFHFLASTHGSSSVSSTRPTRTHRTLSIPPRRVLLSAAVSVLFLVPCFWQERIQSADLSSHIYNVWLAQLVHDGAAPGLWLAPQTNNFLFDLL